MWAYSHAKDFLLWAYLYLKFKTNPAEGRTKLSEIIVDINLQSVDDSIAPLGLIKFFGKTGN